MAEQSTEDFTRFTASYYLKLWQEWEEDRQLDGRHLLSLPMRLCVRLTLTPNLLSPQKHVNSDWVRV